MLLAIGISLIVCGFLSFVFFLLVLSSSLYLLELWILVVLSFIIMIIGVGLVIYAYKLSKKRDYESATINNQKNICPKCGLNLAYKCHICPRCGYVIEGRQS
jgi:hypothetical protein